jgi:hypothetical protein
MSVTGVSDNASLDLSAYPRSLRSRIANDEAISSTKQASKAEPRSPAVTEIISSARESLVSKMEEAGIGSRSAPSTSVAAALEAFSSF